MHCSSRSFFIFLSTPTGFSFWVDSGMSLSAGVSENAAKSLFFNTHLTKHNSFHIDDIKLRMTSNPKTLVLVTLDIWIYKTKEPL